MIKYTIVPEELIKKSSETGDEDSNVYQKLLKAGQEYKDADMTPIYIYDPSSKNLIVAAEETLGKKLH